jgi:hypothetical protein
MQQVANRDNYRSKSEQNEHATKSIACLAPKRRLFLFATYRCPSNHSLAIAIIQPCTMSISFRIVSLSCLSKPSSRIAKLLDCFRSFFKCIEPAHTKELVVTTARLWFVLPLSKPV